MRFFGAILLSTLAYVAAAFASPLGSGLHPKEAAQRQPQSSRGPSNILDVLFSNALGLSRYTPLQDAESTATEAPVTTTPRPAFNLTEALNNISNHSDNAREQIRRLRNIYHEEGIRGVIKYLNTLNQTTATRSDVKDKFLKLINRTQVGVVGVAHLAKPRNRRDASSQTSVARGTDGLSLTFWRPASESRQVLYEQLRGSPKIYRGESLLRQVQQIGMSPPIIEGLVGPPTLGQTGRENVELPGLSHSVYSRESVEALVIYLDNLGPTIALRTQSDKQSQNLQILQGIHRNRGSDEGVDCVDLHDVQTTPDAQPDELPNLYYQTVNAEADGSSFEFEDHPRHRARRNSAGQTSEAPALLEELPTTPAPSPPDSPFNLSQALYGLSNRTDKVHEHLVRMQEIYSKNGFRAAMFYLYNVGQASRSTLAGDDKLPLFSGAPAIVKNNNYITVLSAPREIASRLNETLAIDLTTLMPLLMDPEVLRGNPQYQKLYYLKISMKP